jgi:hypothetical protein
MTIALIPLLETSIQDMPFGGPFDHQTRVMAQVQDVRDLFVP